MSVYNQEVEDIEIESVADLAEQMVYRLSGCDPTMIRKQLQAAYADFARVTKCFMTTRMIETEEDCLDYPVVATLPYMYVDAISSVWIDNYRLLTPLQYRVSLAHGVPTVHLVNAAESNKKYSLTRPDGSVNPQVTRAQVEQVGGNLFEPKMLRIRLVEMPRVGSEFAPRWFFDKYGEGVIAGAFVRLFSMTGKAWSDAAQAQSELLRYENFTTNARLESVSDEASPFGNGAVCAIDTSGLL